MERKLYEGRNAGVAGQVALCMVLILFILFVELFVVNSGKVFAGGRMFYSTFDGEKR